MQMINVTTRTLEPTDHKPKRVRVKTSEGLEAEYPWDHAHDAPEVHENAALKATQMTHQGSTVTMQRIGSGPMGYTFRALIEDAPATI